MPKVFKCLSDTLDWMNDKKLLIAGIDPGITTGFAVLDIEGHVLHIKSSKQLDLNLLISETVKLGRVILVGTDKEKVPSLIEAYATKLGATIIRPKEDIKVDEKRKTISDFKVGDEHQGDALASALLAFKEKKPLLDKIDFFVKENKKQSIKDKIKQLVITKNISIRTAVGIIEKKDEKAQIIEKVIVERKLSENDFLKLYRSLQKYKLELVLVRRYNKKLQNRLKNFEKEMSLAAKKNVDAEKPIDFRENRIKFLEAVVKTKEKEKEKMKVLIRKLNNIISNINNLYVLKRLENFGITEFNLKNKILNIQKNDILIVDNPSIFNNEVISMLKDKVFVVINKNSVSEKTENELPFVFIDCKNLKIEEDRYFGFVEKRHFEAEKNKLDWARKIIDDYKREKQLMR